MSDTRGRALGPLTAAAGALFRDTLESMNVDADMDLIWEEAIHWLTSSNVVGLRSGEYEDDGWKFAASIDMAPSLKAHAIAAFVLWRLEIEACVTNEWIFSWSFVLLMIGREIQIACVNRLHPEGLYRNILMVLEREWGEMQPFTQIQRDVVKEIAISLAKRMEDFSSMRQRSLDLNTSKSNVTLAPLEGEHNNEPDEKNEYFTAPESGEEATNLHVVPQCLRTSSSLELPSNNEATEEVKEAFDDFAKVIDSIVGLRFEAEDWRREIRAEEDVTPESREKKTSQASEEDFTGLEGFLEDIASVQVEEMNLEELLRLRRRIVNGKYIRRLRMYDDR